VHSKELANFSLPPLGATKTKKLKSHLSDVAIDIGGRRLSAIVNTFTGLNEEEPKTSPAIKIWAVVGG